MAVTLIQSDLQFILEQILIAEAHAAGAELNEPHPQRVLALGTAHGRWLLQQSGAGPRIFRRRRAALPDDRWILSSGMKWTRPILRHIGHELWRRCNVVDSDPRMISNLIVDQTITNPAAVQAFVEGGFGVLVGLPGTFCIS